MMQLGAERRAAAALRLERVVLLIDEMELERRRRAQHALRRRGILDAGQLDEDAVESLALHDGFGHAELVDAIAQRQRVLLDREVLALADRGLREAAR